jgi:hypothetical protein
MVTLLRRYQQASVALLGVTEENLKKRKNYAGVIEIFRLFLSF